MKKGIALTVGIIGLILYIICVNKDVVKHNDEEVTMDHIAEEVRQMETAKKISGPEGQGTQPSAEEPGAKKEAPSEKTASPKEAEAAEEKLWIAAEALIRYFDKAGEAYAQTPEDYIENELLPLTEYGISFSPELLELIRQKRRFDELLSDSGAKEHYNIREQNVTERKESGALTFYTIKLRIAYGDNLGSGEGKTVYLAVKCSDDGRQEIMDFFMEEWEIRGGNGKEYDLYKEYRESGEAEYSLLKNIDYEKKYHALKQALEKN